jgi:hypothetical protein
VCQVILLGRLAALVSQRLRTLPASLAHTPFSSSRVPRSGIASAGEFRISPNSLSPLRWVKWFQSSLKLTRANSPAGSRTLSDTMRASEQKAKGRRNWRFRPAFWEGGSDDLVGVSPALHSGHSGHPYGLQKCNIKNRAGRPIGASPVSCPGECG